MLLLAVLVVALSSSLVSCGQNPTSAQINMTCASIESYGSTKALALATAAQGSSATEFIDSAVAPLLDGIDGGTEAVEIFSEYLKAMKIWAHTVELHQIDSNSSNLSKATEQLEREIDALAVKCQSNGWKFQAGWRS